MQHRAHMLKVVFNALAACPRMLKGLGTGLPLAQHQICKSSRLHTSAVHLLSSSTGAVLLTNNFLRPTRLLTSMPRGKAAAKGEAATASPSPRHKRKAEPASSAEGDGDEGAVPAAAASPKKKRSTPAKKKVTVDVDEGEAPAAAALEEAEEAAGTKPAAKKKPAARKPKSKAAPAAAADEGDEAAEEADVKPAPAKKPRKAAAPKGPPGEVYKESMRRPAPDQPTTKVMSWNVAGIRALIKKDPKALSSLIKREAPDVVCLQEIKISDQHISDVQASLGLPEGWHAEWSCSQDKAGYSGVATFSRVRPISVQRGLDLPEHDGEGRLITTEFNDFYVMNVYVPNSGDGLKRLDYRVKDKGWDDSLAAAVKKLQEVKPVILTGDLNCAHKEIDIHNPKTNLKSAGFTPEERESFGSRYLSEPASGGCGLVDTYRAQFPDIVAYTYYSYRFNCRAKGIGWRLDYVLASQALMSRVHDSWLLPDVVGSDHVPLGVTLIGRLEGA